MPSRFSFIAMAFAAPVLLLAACERETQQQAEVGQAEAPAAGEPEVAAPGEQAQTQPIEPQQAPASPQPAEPPGDGEAVTAPPAEEPAPADEQQAAQPPGEPSPEAAGVASVSAYVGRWAEEPQMCQRSFWTFTNLGLQSPDGFACDILTTEEREDGLDLEIACTAQDRPLAERTHGTMTLTFPNMPQTDTMAMSGGPLEEELTLDRCPLG